MTTYAEEVIRRNAVAWARSCAGVSAHPAGPTWGRYVELVAPGETPRRQAEMARESSCGLFLGRGYLRAVLATVPAPLAGAYVDGRALADLRAAAAAAAAVRPPTHRPAPGDIVHLAAGPGGCEHVYLVVGAEPLPDELGGLGVDSIDGGQRLGAYEAVLARQRVLVTEGAGVEDQEIGGATRSVCAVYDLATLVAAYGAAPAMLDGA